MKRIVAGLAVCILAGCASPGKERFEPGRHLGRDEAVQQAALHLNRKHLYSAYLSLMAGVELSPDILKEEDASELRGRLVREMTAKSQACEAAGLLGNAYHWQELALKLGGTDQTGQQRLQGIRERLRQRVVKKIAVTDFTPPAGSADAGRLVTGRLLSYMAGHAGRDVKILARDMPGATIGESEFSQAGLHDIENVKKNGTLTGADAFIFGSVLQYNVERSAEEHSKVVDVSVARRRVSNPAYQSWLQRNPSPGERELALAPPALIDEDVRKTVHYKVGTHKKIANVALSFRVFDVESGEVVIARTITSRKEAQDDFSEGVASANIPFDPLQLPPDTGLLEQAVEESSAELGRLVLSRFRNRQADYLNAAELLGKKGQHELAVERYIDAVVSEEVQNVPSQVTEQAHRGIGRQLRLADGM